MQSAEGKQQGVNQEGSWRRYFRFSDQFREQKGQAGIWEIAASVKPEAAEVIAWLFELCTGYGKTLVAFGVFWILKQRGLVSHMLVLVPTDEQREQFAGDANTANALLGISLRAPWIVTKTEREIRVVREGLADVFIASYQQLENDGGHIGALLGHRGCWLVVPDECHHLGEVGKWAERTAALPAVRFRAGLSATPIRADRARLLGVPNAPTVKVGYQEAFKEQVVKKVRGRIGHYFLDVDINGERTRLTTEGLREEGESDFSRYEVKRQLRYNGDYLAQSLIEPLNDLAEREVEFSGQNRMIIFAMTCKHAHYVTTQTENLCRQLDLKFKAAWIGVGEGMEGDSKTLEQNRQVIKAFKSGEIQILVQVAKAGEGFNVPEASVLVFLHLVGAPPRLLQQIGRGLRRNRAIPFPQDTVSCYASSETAIAAVIETMEIEAGKEPEPGPGGGGGLFDIPDLVLIEAQHDRTDTVFPRGIEWMTQEQRDFCTRWNIPPEEYLKHHGAAPVGRRTAAGNAAPGRTPQDLLRETAAQVEKNTRLLTTNLIRLMRGTGIEIEKETVGKIKRSINAEWLRVSQGMKHDAMLAPDFERKNKWLQVVNVSLKEAKEVPPWVEW